MAHRSSGEWICEKCKNGEHDDCEDWTSCLCALSGHRVRRTAKHAKPRRWGRRKDT